MNNLKALTVLCLLTACGGGADTGDSQASNTPTQKLDSKRFDATFTVYADNDCGFTLDTHYENYFTTGTLSQYESQGSYVYQLEFDNPERLFIPDDGPAIEVPDLKTPTFESEPNRFEYAMGSGLILTFIDDEIFYDTFLGRGGAARGTFELPVPNTNCSLFGDVVIAD